MRGKVCGRDYPSLYHFKMTEIMQGVTEVPCYSTAVVVEPVEGKPAA